MATTVDYQMRFYDLPLSRLHVLEAGTGAPLIMVPATISECKDWIHLVRFMAQWFHVYFFELPGHGESTPFTIPFTTDLVAETIEQLVDSIGIQRFSLMGFSFGGILTIKTFNRLSDRVEGVILVAPCLTCRAVKISEFRGRLVQTTVRFLNRPPVRKVFVRMLHDPHLVTPIFRFLQQIGQLESTIELRPKLLTIRESTVDVLSGQIGEIFTTHFPEPIIKHSTPCFFAMSVNDPTLDFKTTLAVARNHFANMEVIRSDEPYHQSPVPFTYESLNRKYYDTVSRFLTNGRGQHSIQPGMDTAT